MEIIDLYKHNVGFLIHYYRKKLDVSLDIFLKNNKTFYTQYCLSCNKCTNLETICSPKTLYKIENGLIPRSECVYYQLCEKLNKSIDLNHEILNNHYKFHIKIQSLLIDSLLNFSKSNLCKIKTLLVQHQSYRHLIFFNEIFNFYCDFIDFKLEQKLPNSKNIEIYLYLKNFINEVDKKLILLLFYEIKWKINLSQSALDNIVLECHSFIDDPLFYSFKLDSICNNNLLNAYVYLEQNEFSEFDKKNPVDQYYLLNHLAYIQLNSSAFDNAYISINKCINIMKDNDDCFSKPTILACYKKLGIICFQLNKYNESVSCFQKVINNNLSIGINYSLFFHSLEKLHDFDTINEMINKIDINHFSNYDEKTILIYYKMKYTSKNLSKYHLSELEDYICINIKPLIPTLGSIQNHIFLSDLKWLISKTNNYKKLFIFQK